MVERTNSSTSLSYNDIINIFKDSNGEIWIGTYGGGINHLKNKTPEGDFVFDKIKEADGLSSNLVFKYCRRPKRLFMDWDRFWIKQTTIPKSR